MKTSASKWRTVGVALVAVAVAGGAAACSSSGDDSAAGSGGGTYTIWDPYPQFDDDSDWVKLLKSCGTDGRGDASSGPATTPPT